MILRTIQENSANIRYFLRNRPRAKTSCNWPEVSRYYGCCKLSTGIYVKTLISMAYTILLLYFCKEVLLSLNVFEREFNVHTDFNDKYLEPISFTRYKIFEVILFIRAVRVFYIFWTAVKLLYIILSILLAYSVYKGNAFFMKITFFIMTPTSVFDLFMSFIGTAVLSVYIQGMVFFMFLMELYNVVAVSSEYKRLVGKSRIVKNDSEPNIVQINPNVLLRRASSPPEYRSIYGQSNQGCNHLDNVSYATEIPSTHSEQLSPLSSPRQNETQTKPLNFKDENIIFDQDQFADGHQLVASNPKVCNSAKQSVLYKENGSLFSNTDKKHSKIDVIDIPIIYDESQLNIGESPVYKETVSSNT